MTSACTCQVPPLPRSSVSLVLIPWKDNVRSERGWRERGMRLNPSLRRRKPFNPEERKRMRSEEPGEMPETKSLQGHGRKLQQLRSASAGGWRNCGLLAVVVVSDFPPHWGEIARMGPRQGNRGQEYMRLKTLRGFRKVLPAAGWEGCRTPPGPRMAEVGRWWRNGKWQSGKEDRGKVRSWRRKEPHAPPLHLLHLRESSPGERLHLND